MSSAEEVAALEAALKTARAKQAEAEQETPHTVLLADLADHRVNPVHLGATLARLFAAFELLGVDLLAEDGPAKVSAKTAATSTPAPSGEKTGKESK